MRFVLRTLVGALAGVALLAAACGGDGAESNAGTGRRITDPAAVPSSTPIQNPVVYHITNDVVTTSGGSGTAGTGATPAGGPKSYTVKPGDTCAAIALQFGITTEALLKTNRTIDAACGNLHEGDTLRIPTASTTPTAGNGGISGPTPKPSGREYTVKSGDTCAGIAQSYSVDVNQFIALNGIDANCQNLKAGQTVKIP
jgi:LysM repeat protein